MTTLDKLALSGIRSYDDSSQAVIKFFRPLTILVGQNGCGKTTIIEALKWVCSGEAPPLSDRGRSFAHDPRHCSKKSCKCQVKVAFRTAEGKEVIAVSSMQVTLSRSKLSLKTLDSCVKTAEGSLTLKMSDMRLRMAHLLGVSSAILDSVIFCHQSESEWPLFENKRLKERFDEIFATSGWAKSLTALNQKMKDVRNQDLKDAQCALSLANEKLDQLNRLKGDIEGCQKEIEQCEEEMKSKQRSLGEIDQFFEEKQSLIEEWRALEMELKVLSSENDSSRIVQLKKDVDYWYDKMDTEFEESDESILKSKLEWQSKLESIRTLLPKKKKSRDDMSEELRTLQNRSRSLASEKGALKQKESEIEQCKQELAMVFRKCGMTWSMDEDATAMRMEMVRKCDECEQRLNELTAIHKEQVQSFESEWQKVQNEMAQMQGEERQSSKRIAEVKSEIKSLQSEMQRLLKKCPSLKSDDSHHSADSQSQSQQSARMEESRVNALERKLGKQIARLNGEVAQLEGALIPELEDREKQLSDTVVKMQNANQVISEAKSAQRRFEEAHSKWVSVRGPCEKGLKDISLAQVDPALDKSLCRIKCSMNEFEFGKSDINSSEWYSMIRTEVISKLEARKQEVTKEVTQVSQSMAVAKSKLKGMLADQAQLQSRKDKALSIVREVYSEFGNESSDSTSMDERSLETWVRKECEQSEILLRTAVEELKITEAASAMYKKYNSLAEAKNHCAVCRRKFESAEQKSAFVKQNEKRIAKMGSDRVMTEQQRALEYHECRRDGLHSTAKPQIDLITEEVTPRMAQLEKDIHKVREEIGECDQRITEELRPKLQRMNQVSVELKSVNDTSVLKLTQMKDECWKAHREWVEMKGVLEQHSGEESRLDKAQQSLDECRTQLRKAHQQRREKERLVTEKQQKLVSEQQMIVQMKEANAERDKHQALWDKAKKDLDERREALTILERKVGRMRDMVEAKQKEVRLLDERRTTAMRESEAAVNEARTQSSVMNDRNQQSERLMGRVHMCEEQAREMRGDITEEERRAGGATAERESELETQMSRVSEEIKKLEKREGDLSEGIEDAESNLRFREKQRELDKAEERPRWIHARLQSEEMKQVRSKVEELEEERKRDEQSVIRMQGRVESERSRLQSIEARVHSLGLSEAEQSQRQAFHNLMSVRCMLESLRIVHSHLDKALVSFHSDRMSEINRILRDLWQSTYRGSDIECIRLESSAQSGSKKNWAYSLRMLIGDSSLEMRGRCSAGQSVLASILVRLALAQTFCGECGILALDEPTTNLDTANVEALAFALRRIIERRRREAKFQLICITHDEHFVDLLGQREHCDCFYRVTKDDQGHSTVKLYRFGRD